MPHLRPRNNIILPKEVHDGILWKEEKAIRKAQLASLLENQKSKRKYSKSDKVNSGIEAKAGTSETIPQNRKNNVNTITHRSIIRYSLSPEYLANHKYAHKQLPQYSAASKYNVSPKPNDTSWIDEENMTPSKKKMYLAQRKFAQNDHHNAIIHDASLSNPLHASPSLMEILGPATSPGVIQTGRTISFIRENFDHNVAKVQARGLVGNSSSVIRRTPVSISKSRASSSTTAWRKSRSSTLRQAPDINPKGSGAKSKLVNHGEKLEPGVNGSKEVKPLDTLDTTDFLSWLYMRHLPEMPSHLKDVDNYMKTFLAQKIHNA